MRNSRRCLRVLSICIVASLFGSVAAGGNEGMGRIVGKVTDENGLPLPNAAVIVLGKQIGAGTDSTGSYSLPLLPEGIFILRAAHEGFAKGRKESVAVSAGRTTMANFRLDKAEIRSKTSGPSGGERFAVDLYRRLASVPGNLFFSPWSIRTALGMAYAGARTHTEAAMARALHDREGKRRFHTEASGIDDRSRTHGSRSEILSANAVWIAEGLPLVPAFADTLASLYDAPPRRANFVSTEAARETINAWVEERTRERIQDLIPPGGLSRATRLVLVNATYLRAPWEDSFASSATSDASFHAESGRIIKTPFMRADRDLRIFESTTLQVLELPYAHASTVMLIILPRDSVRLTTLEQMLDADTLLSWLSHLRPALVRVALPKFRIDRGYELTDGLGKMGMADAFTPEADFSGISGERPLYLSNVFHKAYVQIDERGTEAAAGSSAELKRSIAIRSATTPLLFYANHPFLFLIRSRMTGAILFMGRVADPS
jgi:serpin B